MSDARNDVRRHEQDGWRRAGEVCAFADGIFATWAVRETASLTVIREAEARTMILRIEDTMLSEQARTGPGDTRWIEMAGRGLGRRPVYHSQRTDCIARRQRNVSRTAAHFVLLPGGKNMQRGSRRTAQDEEPKGAGTAARHACPCAGVDLRLGREPAIRFRYHGGTKKFLDAGVRRDGVLNDEMKISLLLRSGKGDESWAIDVPTRRGVDDIDMRITHVIRGADHISIRRSRAAVRRWERSPPVFAHVP